MRSKNTFSSILQALTIVIEASAARERNNGATLQTGLLETQDGVYLNYTQSRAPLYSWMEANCSTMAEGSGIFFHGWLLGYNITLEAPPFVKSMFTTNVSQADYKFAVKQNEKMSDKNVESLLINHAFAGWRDVLRRIDTPALVISRDVSVNNATGISWAATQIPGAKSYTFTAEEKGSHFMFWENPERFNSIIKGFATS